MWKVVIGTGLVWPVGLFFGFKFGAGAGVLVAVAMLGYCSAWAILFERD